MMRTPRSLVVLLAASLTLAMAACGGGDPVQTPDGAQVPEVTLPETASPGPGSTDARPRSDAQAADDDASPRDSSDTRSSSAPTGGDDAAGDESARAREQRPRSRRERRRSTPRRPSQAAIARAGDRLCADFRRGVAALPQEPDTTEGVARRTARLRALLRDTVRGFRALERPRRGAAELRRYIEALEAQQVVLRELQEAAERDDRQGVSVATQAAQEIGERARARARAFGFRVCGTR